MPRNWGVGKQGPGARFGNKVSKAVWFGLVSLVFFSPKDGWIQWFEVTLERCLLVLLRSLPKPSCLL